MGGWVGSSCGRTCGTTDLRERKERCTSREHSNANNAIEVYLDTVYACMRMCDIRHMINRGKHRKQWVY